MEDKVRDGIEEKLKVLGFQIKDIKEYLFTRLVSIESAIQEQEKQYFDGIDLISKSNYSVKSIAELTNCSRTTLYNNPLLTKYIELSLKQFQDKKNPINADSLVEEKNILTKQIQMMEIRDIHDTVKEIEYEQLKERIATLEKDKETLYLRLNRLTKEINTYKAKEVTESNNNNTISNIITMHK